MVEVTIGGVPCAADRAADIDTGPVIGDNRGCDGRLGDTGAACRQRTRSPRWRQGWKLRDHFFNLSFPHQNCAGDIHDRRTADLAPKPDVEGLARFGSQLSRLATVVCTVAATLRSRLSS